MATSRAQRHKSEQTALARLLAGEVAPLIVPQSPPSLSELVDALVALTLQYNRASASLAGRYFDQERAAAGAATSHTTILAAPPATDQVVHSLGWATRDLANPTVDLDAVLERVDGAASRLTLDGGRSTLTGAAAADPVCRGFVRVARPGSCAFCSLLSIRVFDRQGNARGVYKTEATAQRRGRGADEDKYHDNCRCSVQPIFRGQDYEPPEHVREFARIYRETSRAPGQSGLAAYRQALAAERG